MNEGISGGAAGADHVFAPGLRLGVMAGMGQGHFSIGGGAGLAKVTFEEVAVTADFVRGPLYMNALVGGGTSHGTTTRTISLPGLTATAIGQPKSDQMLADAELGYATPLDSTFSLAPFAGVDAASANQHAFSETGAGMLNLAVKARTTTSVRSILGTRLNGTGIALGSMKLNTELTMGWAHQFSTLNPAVSEAFAGQANTSFIVSGAPLARDSAVAGLGLSAKLGADSTISLHYDGQFAGNATSHTITAGVSIGW